MQTCHNWKLCQNVSVDTTSEVAIFPGYGEKRSFWSKPAAYPRCRTDRADRLRSKVVMQQNMHCKNQCCRERHKMRKVCLQASFHHAFFNYRNGCDDRVRVSKAKAELGTIWLKSEYTAEEPRSGYANTGRYHWIFLCWAVIKQTGDLCRQEIKTIV